MKTCVFIISMILIFHCRPSEESSIRKIETVENRSEYLLNRAVEEQNKNEIAGFKIIRDKLPVNQYLVDTTHSSIEFRVRHWGIYDVVGRIERYEVVVHFDQEDFSDLVVEARIKPAGINMPNKEMAQHLKAPGFGFFEIAKYPEVIFKSTGVEKIADSTFVLSGQLKIKEVIRPMHFDVHFNGYTHPPTRTTPGFTMHGKIDRLAFDLGDDELLPGNELPMIGHQVYITCNLRLIGAYD